MCMCESAFLPRTPNYTLTNPNPPIPVLVLRPGGLSTCLGICPRDGLPWRRASQDLSCKRSEGKGSVKDELKVGDVYKVG